VYEEYGLWRALVVDPGLKPGQPFRARSVPVVLGPGDPREGWVEIYQGLRAGDRVLVPERVETIREGQRVVEGPVAGVWLPPYASSATPGPEAAPAVEK
jgi:hypothetical protein